MSSHILEDVEDLAMLKGCRFFQKGDEGFLFDKDEQIRTSDKQPGKTTTESFKLANNPLPAEQKISKDQNESQKDQDQVSVTSRSKECRSRLENTYRPQERVAGPQLRVSKKEEARQRPPDKNWPRRSSSNARVFDREKKQQIENLTKEVRDAEATIDRTKKKLDAARARISVLESDLNASKRTVTLLNEKTTHDNQLIDVLHDKLRAAEMKFQSRELEIKKQMEKYEREIVVLKGEVEASHILMEDLRHQISEKERQLEDFKSDKRVTIEPQQDKAKSDLPQSPKNCTEDTNEYIAMNMAAEAEKERLLELVRVLNRRLDRERDESEKLSDLYKRERNKATKLETKLQKIELERVGLSKANTGSYRMRAPKPMVPSSNDLGDSEEIRLKLELLEEECLTLKTRLSTTQRDKDADLDTFKKMLEQTRNIFKDAYREKLPMTGRRSTMTS